MVQRIPEELFGHRAARELFCALRKLGPEVSTLDFSTVTSHLEGATERLALRLLVREPDHDAHRDRKQDKGEPPKALLLLKIRFLDERAATLQPEIQKAAAAGDVTKREELKREKGRLVAESAQLKRALRGREEPR